MTSHVTLWEILRGIQVLPTFAPSASVLLGGDEFQEVLARYSHQIERAAKRIAKAARSNVEALNGASIYRGLDVRQLRRAAEVAEVLRSMHLTYNAGRLDIAGLQERIHQASVCEGPVAFELAWGQAKRDAGFLKTAGFGADLCEFVAICRLGILAKAAQHLLEKEVIVRVITGGQRFFEALFTNPERDSAYNADRSAFVAALGMADVIRFESIARYWSEAEIEQRLAEALAASEGPACSPDDVAFKFALFSIDWTNILEGARGDPRRIPHGLEAPDVLLDALRDLGDHNRSLVLRHVLATVVNPGVRIDAVEALGLSREGVAEAACWVSDVAAISGRKYELLGPLTPRRPSDADKAITISVIDKIGVTSVPTLMLLGKRAGTTLPQHVVPVLEADGSLKYHFFLTVAKDVHPIYVVGGETQRKREGVGEGVQPICFLTDCRIDAVRSLTRLDLLDPQ